MKLKEQLVQMGLTEEMAQRVINEVVDGQYIPKSRFDEVNEENRTLKQSVSDRDKQLEQLKKTSGDSGEMRKQIEDLQQANRDQQKAHEAELSRLKLDNAIDTALVTAGARNTRAARSLLDMKALKLADDGTVSGLEDAIAAIRKSDSYLFTEKQDAQTFKGFQPGASGEVKPDAKVDTSKMTYSEMVSYLETHPEATIE